MHLFSRPSRSTESGPLDPNALGTILANSGAVSIAVLQRGTIRFCNPAFLGMFGATGSLAGSALSDLVEDHSGSRLSEALAATEHGPAHYFGVGRRGDATEFDVELTLERALMDGVPAIVAFASDVTDQQQLRKQLTSLAYTDALTGLANRALFADRIHEALRHARRHTKAFAVLMIDLDGFKTVNDTLGHDTGDVVLQLVGQRFQGCVRGGDTLARIGGDEFAMLLPHLVDQRTASLVAQRLISALRDQFEFEGRAILVGASIGIAAWPEHAGTVDALLAAADTAMYRAKRSGRNQFQWAAGRAAANITSALSLTWSAAHAVGIGEIDGQHEHLAELIDRLSATLREGADAAAIASKLNELIRFATHHFATEERLMDLHQVEDQGPHREEHRRLLRDICTLKIDGELASVSLILRYLQEWLLRHVDSLDRQLAQALIAKGCG